MIFFTQSSSVFYLCNSILWQGKIIYMQIHIIDTNHWQTICDKEHFRVTTVFVGPCFNMNNCLSIIGEPAVVKLLYLHDDISNTDKSNGTLILQGHRISRKYLVQLVMMGTLTKIDMVSPLIELICIVFKIDVKEGTTRVILNAVKRRIFYLCAYFGVKEILYFIWPWEKTWGETLFSNLWLMIMSKRNKRSCISGYDIIMTLPTTGRYLI